MSKYFREEPKAKLKLSEYLELKEFKCFLCDEKYRKPRTKYLIDCLGDVELDEETYKLFLEEFQMYGGRYNVRTKKETYQGMYEIASKYPTLSRKGLEEIWFYYIKDLFEVYSLTSLIKLYIAQFGETDEMMEEYTTFVDQLAEEHQKTYLKDADKLKELDGEFAQEFIKELMYLVRTQHITSEEIIKALPSRELIDKDKEQLLQLATKYRIYFGTCKPISIQMIESLISDKSLDKWQDEPSYIINDSIVVPTTFTKEEFIKSVESRKQKIYKK